MTENEAAARPRRPAWKTVVLMLLPLPFALAGHNPFLLLIGPGTVLASDWMERRWGPSRREALAREIYQHEHGH
jgi:hypothetical protein